MLVGSVSSIWGNVQIAMDTPLTEPLVQPPTTQFKYSPRPSGRQLLARDPSGVSPLQHPLAKISPGPVTSIVKMNGQSQPQLLSDDEIARNKLLYDGEGFGDDKRITQLMRQIYLWQHANSKEEKDILYNKVLNLLADAEIQCNKYTNIHKTSNKEYEYYEELTKKLDESIEEKRQQIQDIKSDLNKAKIVRKNRMEYDPLVDKILSYPTREESLEKIAKIKRDTETLERYKEDLAQRLEQRKQQLEELITLAKSVHEKLVEDESLNIEELADDIPT